jgi:hypothetical protein
MNEISLHPMTFREIFSLSFQIFFRNYWTLFGLALIFNSPIYLAEYLSKIVKIQNQVILVLLYSAGFIGIFYSYAASTLIVSYTLNQNKAGLMQIIRVLRGRLFLKILGATLLSILIIFAILLPFTIVGLIIIEIMKNKPIGLLVIFSGIVLLIILGVYFLFSFPCIIIENLAIVKSLKKSWRLVKGNWWKIFGRMTFISILIALFVIPESIFYASNSENIALHLVCVVAEIGMYIVLIPFGTVFPVLLYYDLRIRKEALGMESIHELVARLT